MKKALLLTVFWIIGLSNVFGQNSPENAIRIFTYYNPVESKWTINDQVPLTAGIVPGCLDSNHDFAWFYFAVCDSTFHGALSFMIYNTDSIEYAIYGPFTDTLNIAQSIIGKSPIQCQTLSNNVGFNFANHPNGVYYMAANMIPYQVQDSARFISSISGPYFSICNICKGVYEDIANVCLVTVDSLTQKNKIIIDRSDVTNLVGHIIFRENSVSGQYDSLTFVSIDSSNIYIDMSANPNVRNWRYLVHKYSDCGTRLPSVFQGNDYQRKVNTLHLQINGIFNNNINLSWNNTLTNFPEISTSIYAKTTFYVYRSNGVDPFQLIDSLPFNGTNSYTDVSPLNGVNQYKISLKLLGSCDSNSTSNSESFSNKVSTTITGGNELDDQQIIRLFPNPVNNIVSLKLNNRLSEYQINVRSIEGKLCISSNGYNSDEIKLDLSSLGDGFYQIELVSNKKRSFKKVLVNHARVD